MKNKVKLSGGALIEGVMIKNEGQYAMALRKGNSDIEIVHDVYKGILGRGTFNKIPVLRGIFALIDYMGLGIKSFLFSSDFYEDNTKEEPGAIQNFLKKFTGKYHEGFELIACITLAIVLSICGFIVLPHIISGLLADLVIPNEKLMTLLEALLRIGMIVLYIVYFCIKKDFRKICRYHGAQHKVINCLEKGEELTIDNVKKSSTYDRNCEYNFIFWVFVISIIMFAFLRSNEIWIRVALRIGIIPVVAAVLYEIMLITNKDTISTSSVLHVPQKMVQKLFVSEPTEEMVEVAIESLQAVFDWRNHLGYEPEEEGYDYQANNVRAKKDSDKAAINENLNNNMYFNNTSMTVDNNAYDKGDFNNTELIQESIYDNNYYDNTGYIDDAYNNYNNINNQTDYNNLSYDDYNNGQYFVESNGAHNPQYTDLSNVVTRQTINEAVTKQPEFEQNNYNMDYNQMYGEYAQGNGYNNYNNMQYDNMQYGNMYNQGNYGNGYNEDDDLKMLDRYFTDDNY